MQYIVKPLGPDLAGDFVDYLGNLAFDHAPHWSSCFCRFYQADCTREQWVMRTGEQNRTEALEQIRLGNMKGYLAFDGDKCIGWCNANDVSKYTRLKDDLEHVVAGHKAGCVVCFVIRPEYRNQGVARLLLRQAIQDFKAQGFDAVLSLPLEMEGAPEKLYRGTLNMYKEQGFKELGRSGNTHIMWLSL